MRALFFAALLTIGLLLSPGEPNVTVAIPPAAAEKKTFLIRFGADRVADIDWSGTISPEPSRLVGWQFDTNDQSGSQRWHCTSRLQRYWDTPYERSMRPTSTRDTVTEKGVIVEFDRSKSAKAEVVTAQGTFSFNLDTTLWDSPRAFLNARVIVSPVPAMEALSLAGTVEDNPALIEAKDGTLWLAYQSYADGGDQVFVQGRTGGFWSQPEPLTTSGGDYFRTAMAEDRAAKIWVVWSAQVSSNFDLYARAYDGKRWSAPQRLTTAPNSDIFHSLARGQDGNLYLAYQSARNGNFDIFLRIYDGRRWSGEIQVSSSPANDWEPVLAPAPTGGVTILWDTYARGNYDVVARGYENGKLGPILPIAESGAYEARPSAQYDREGRLWIAWDEGDWNWGKDYGNGIPESGRGLITRRQVRVAVLASGKLLEPAHSVAEAIPADLRQVFHQPKIVLDAQNNPWVFFRYRTNLPQARQQSTSRALWRLGASVYRNGQWRPLIEFPEGYGRIDAPVAAILGRQGNLTIIWATDGRLWPTGIPLEQNLIFAQMSSAPSPAETKLIPFVSNAEHAPSSHPAEARDKQRVRAYRTGARGRSFRIVRGDIHRHTDISWDGNRDGSLNDSYRYALDAADFEFLGVCDHQGGQSIPYNWWMLQRAVDLFTIRGKFAPLYSYERSLPWPNGHRNVLFSARARPILAISEAERRGEEGAGKLYDYLRKLGGLTTAHTSATGAGTDWRDSNPELEPVVEIYQGYRKNYEAPEAPRNVGPNEASRYAAGFVWNAWSKGIKLGVQASSDHVSTHISYAALFVERIDREAILEALRSRRSFAATDNLVLDVRMGEHLMGESFKTAGPVPLKAYLAGTGRIGRVDLIKNNQIIYTTTGTSSELRFAFTDTEIKPGEAYYYVRAEQEDGQLAWSSPIWVLYR